MPNRGPLLGARATAARWILRPAGNAELSSANGTHGHGLWWLERPPVSHGFEHVDQIERCEFLAVGTGVDPSQ